VFPGVVLASEEEEAEEDEAGEEEEADPEKDSIEKGPTVVYANEGSCELTIINSYDRMQKVSDIALA
jgi:TATA-binding protein-associated factor Taf7